MTKFNVNDIAGKVNTVCTNLVLHAKADSIELRVLNAENAVQEENTGVVYVVDWKRNGKRVAQSRLVVYWVAVDEFNKVGMWEILMGMTNVVNMREVSMWNDVHTCILVEFAMVVARNRWGYIWEPNVAERLTKETAW